MKQYNATASCDWGNIYENEQIKAGKFSTAFNRAGYMAQTRARRRPKQITITLRLVGTIKKPAAL